MARSFNGTTQSATQAVNMSTLFSNALGTIALWCRPTGTAVQAFKAEDLPGIFDSTGGYLGLARGDRDSLGTDRFFAFNFTGGVETYVEATCSVNVWAHLAWVHTGGNLFLYKDGVSAGSVASGNTDSMAQSVRVGVNKGAVFYAGDIAEIGVWNVALSVNEIAAQARGVSPQRVRSESRTAHWSLYGVLSPEPDWSVSGRSLTLVNTPVLANHPPVSPFFLPPRVTQPQAIAAAAATAAGRMSLLGVGR